MCTNTVTRPDTVVQYENKQNDIRGESINRV